MSKKFWTVLTVCLFFSWGTLAWFTGKIFMADRIALVGILNIITYGAAILAVPVKALIKSNNTKFLVVGSLVTLVGMAMMTQPPLLPLGYLIVGLTRIVLIPCNLAFTAKNLGPTWGAVVTAGAYYGADTVFGLVVKWLFNNNMWRVGPIIGLTFIITSIVTTLLSRSDADVEEPTRPHSLATLGAASITTVYIYFVFGVLNLLLVALAEGRGNPAEAGMFAAWMQGGAFLGLFFAFARFRSRSRLWISIQLIGAFCIVAGFRLEINALIFLGLLAQGLGFSVQERDSEVKYIEGFGNLASASLVFQIIDAGYRITTGTGELLVALVPAYTALWLLPVFPLAHIILLETPLKQEVGKRLTVIGSKEPKKPEKQEQSDT